MKARFISEAFNSKGYEGGNSFGEKTCMELVKKYLPFVQGVRYDELEPRGTQDEPSFGQDEQYAKWDQLSFKTGNEEMDGYSPCFYIVQPFDSNEIGVKFYNDTVAYNGYGEVDDEYVNELEPVSIKKFDEERYLSIIEDMKETFGIEDEEDDYPDQMITR